MQQTLSSCAPSILNLKCTHVKDCVWSGTKPLIHAGAPERIIDRCSTFLNAEGNVSPYC